MEKRVSTRGVIIEEDSIYLMFRRRINESGEAREYYVVPGGGLEEGETLEENVIREIEEEFSVEVKVLGFLGTDEGEETIAHFYACEIVSGTPQLGGPELEKHCESNYYEIKKVNIKDLEEIDLMNKEVIKKAFNKEYK
jgi:8-oxo-dGTP diphosphatase